MRLVLTGDEIGLIQEALYTKIQDLKDFQINDDKKRNIWIWGFIRQVGYISRDFRKRDKREMILEKYIGKKIKLYFENEWQPHHFSSCTFERNLLGVDEQGVLISNDKENTVHYYPFLLRYKVILDINSDAPQVELKADTENAESSDGFESNDIKAPFLTYKTLELIRERLSQLNALAITLQIAHANIVGEQPLFQEMFDNISFIKGLIPVINRQD